jgi:L-lactate permease
MVWQQIYDPLGNMFLSTLLAAIPVVVMLVGLGFLHMKAHIAAGAGLAAVLTCTGSVVWCSIAAAFSIGQCCQGGRGGVQMVCASSVILPRKRASTLWIALKESSQNRKIL